MVRRGKGLDHPTLGDVAAAAGVSRATAARALGGYGRVSEESREAVVAAAGRLAYRVNTLARSMITGTTHTIGVVIADIELSFFARAVRGITDVAQAAGFEVILANSDEDQSKERTAIGVLLEKRVDGLIVTPASIMDSGHLVDLVERGLPLVLLDRGARGVSCDTIVVDNRRAAQNAVSHLVRLGHRRIAIVLEAQPTLSAAELEGEDPGPAGAMPVVLREFGWAAALRSAGVRPTDDLIRRCRYDRDAARQATAAALAMVDPPTAFFTTDEMMTLGALDAILAAGFNIPDEVSVIAFDDAAWTTLLRPPLTVVSQPLYELGATAARRLLARIVGGEEHQPGIEILSTSFLLRGSTAPPPRT